VLAAAIAIISFGIMRSDDPESGSRARIIPLIDANGLMTACNSKVTRIMSARTRCHYSIPPTDPA